tara:strand:- start:180 stop:947 length:768 start_codon:yes stop_codon:yes gene_type:complete
MAMAGTGIVVRVSTGYEGNFPMLKQLLCVAFLAASLNAHGGQYRGPADVVPPGPGGNTGRPSGPTTGGPAGPSTGRPSGPATGSPSGPATGGPTGPRAPGRGPQTGGRGSRLGADLTQWSFWWEFNKDPFIHLKDAIHSGGPQTGSDDFYLGSTRRDAHNSLAPTKKDSLDILATLRRAMRSTNNKDIISACMIAMAKIGDIHPDFKLIDVFKPRLESKNQEIRETAILAMGIAASDESKALELLIQTALGKKIK